jgi:hypothetical protein
MRNGSFEATVLVNGKPVREYTHENQIFVEGRKGSDFTLKFRNITSKRVLVIPSVDGLSVMDGKEAGPESRGYIVSAYGTITIPGWRLDNDKVAQFFFQDRKRAYAEQAGEGGQNVGVIGFLVYEEQEIPKIDHQVHIHTHYPPITPAVWRIERPYAPWQRPEWVRDTTTWCDSTKTVETYGSGATAVGAAPQMMDAGITQASATLSTTSAQSAEYSPQGITEDYFSVGTGFGKATEHKVTETAFRRKDTPAGALVLFYDNRKGLERRGIDVIREKQQYADAMPNAFPGMQPAGCVPPKGWRG